MSDALKFENVGKNFCNFNALDDVTFSVKKGQFHAFIGSNGAGKTTLIRCLLGFYLDFAGKISIDNIDSKDFHSKQKIGYIPEVADFPKILTTYEYLYHFALISGLSKKDAITKVNSLLETYNMNSPTYKNKSPFFMSSGQKKLVLLMQALLNDPTILILDEPVANLDPQNRLEFYEAIKKFHEQGNTIFISSHILSELEKYIDSYTQIENGKIIQSGSLNEHNDKLIYNWIFELSRANDVAKFIDLLKKNNFEFSIKNEQTFLLKLTSEKHKNELLNLIIQDNISFSKFEEYKQQLGDIYFEKNKKNNK